MEKQTNLSPGSVQLDFASAFYAGKPEVAAAAAALSHALGPPKRPAKRQLTSLQVESSQPLWPSTIVGKHPMPPPAKKLQVRRRSSVLPQTLPVAKLPLPAEQVQNPLQQVSPVLDQLSPKVEVPLLLPMPATSLGVMLNSQYLWNETSSESKKGSERKRGNCNCKNSKCLKLYCACFASGKYCNDCHCTKCSNNISHEAARQDAINAVMERNPVAFMPKIGKTTHAVPNCKGKAENGPLISKHTRGCNCKRSGCLKNYCECFQSNVLCSEKCKCMDCKNYESNEDMKDFSRISQQCGVYIDHVQDPVLKGIVRSSAVLSHTSENVANLPMASLGKDQPALIIPVPTEDTKSHVQLGHLGVTYRPLLADIIQIGDINELCKVLVEVSRKTARTFQDSGVKDNTCRRKVDQTESCISNTKHVVAAQKHDPQVCSSENSLIAFPVTEGRAQLSRSDFPDGWKDNRKPVSPRTQVLMCSEQDCFFQMSRVENAIPSIRKESLSDVYKEQEKHVLENFRDYLREIINCSRHQEEKALVNISEVL